MNFLRSVLMAAAAPSIAAPGGGGGGTPPAAPQITIPKISELSKAPGAAPGGTPPGGPQPPAPTTTPITAPGPQPLAPEEPQIDTQIVKPRGEREDVAPPPGGKTPADFARERREAAQRQAATTIEEANRRADEALMQFQQRQTEFEQLQQKHTELENRFKEIEQVATTRKTEIDGLQGSYYDQNRVSLDLNSDSELQTHTTKMLTELRSNLPSRVKTAAGTEQRVFFDTLLNQPGTSNGLNQILDTYARAKQIGNEASCDLAVNAFAKMLGADVDMSARDEKDWKTLKSDDPVFKAVEVAMDKALPHFVDRTNRLTSFQQDVPRLARQQFDERTIGIRQSLSQQIFLAPEVAAGRLQANQQDAEALFSQIVSQVPALKSMVENIIAEVSPTFAALSKKLNLPTLVENTPAAISAHQQEVARHHAKISKMMRSAIIGEAAPTVIAVLAAERDAAEARADAAARNTNPGGGRSGGAGGSPEPDVDTQIVKPGM